MLTDRRPHTIDLPRFVEPQARVALPKGSASSPNEVAQTWLDSFASALAAGDVTKLKALFHTNCWWRDHLGLSWDYHTLHPLSRIEEFLSDRLSQLQLSNFRLAEIGSFTPSKKTPTKDLDWVESMFEFETKTGRGKGVFRLVQGHDDVWKAYTVYTSLQELKGYEEAAGKRRPHGGNNKLQGGLNWLERRQRKIEFKDEEPTAFIVGAGQAGLNIAARLQALNVSCLIIDRNPRVGDNWRNRYRTLSTHDLVHTCHMAYLQFPSNWPFFTPKDKLADWFESYASINELNVWLSTSITASSWSDDDKTWTISVKRGDKNGEERTLKPKYVVFCTGHSGEPKIPTFPGQDNFKGTVYHASQHKDASSSGQDVTGKKVIVLGSGNSGHDIAQNFSENGAAVTMVQRSPTYVISASIGLLELSKGIYDDDALRINTIDETDVYAQSLPYAIQWALGVETTKRIAGQESELLSGLRKAGFALSEGIDGGGIMRLYMQKGGGYYIDVGASKMIAEGKIKVVQSVDGIKEFEADKLVLADGRKLEADIVVLATGYDNMRTSLRKAFGDEVADRCKDVWDLDDEGEINAMWRPSGHPGVFFMGGNLLLCRIYSKLLALQIKAIEEGLNPR
ncbi:hypothetical protein H2199_001427 [Coniosporium tulheliwenetii]|uniref:Uncharacterized protein n=1 Tax=Coniosporium tulheliwenetii TaxID=3383036 RepID=A0ACC2ZLV2_9PEZI|nr:hypothetical protein H2199_001427 [Cladosporium sp. JES 115]